jgi:PAS domain S-box-containing protein
VPPFEGELMSEQTTILRSLFEAVPGALVGVDREGVIRFVNRQTEDLFGYHEGDLVGQPLETLLPEVFRQEHAAHLQGYLMALARRTRVDRDGADGALEQNRVVPPSCPRGQRRDGTEFPVNISLSNIDTEDGLLVIAAVHDLNDGARSAQRHELTSRLAAIVENSGDAIIGKTTDGIITSWNPAAERMYGYLSEEIIGRSIEVLSPQDRADEMTAILHRVRQGWDVGNFETSRVCKDGTVVLVSLSVSPIRDRDGAIVGASTIARDVTEVRKASAAARSMLEASLDSLVAISPEGRITDANEATVRVTGVPREQLIGTAFSDCFTDPRKANEIYQRVFAEGMAVDYPLTMRHRNGSLTEVLYNASVYRDAGGEVLGVFAAARDVTKQVYAQRDIAERQAREMERLVELERFQRLTVGRELRMIELKKEIETLRRDRP